MSIFATDDLYESWRPKVPILKLGLRVKRDDKDEHGTVIQPGPYGDQPFQIRLDNGEVDSFIWDDGTSPYNRYTWVPA